MLKSKKNKKKLLFVSCYYENLKAYLPLLYSIEKDYEIYLLAQYVPYGSDKELNKKVLRRFKGELIESFELGDQFSWKKENAYNNRWSRLFERFYKTLLIEYKANKKAKEVIDKVKPNLLINGGDGRVLERHLIQYSETKNIKSICFQWVLSLISKKSITERKTDSFILQKNSFFNGLKDSLFNLTNWFVKKFNGLLILVLNLRAKVRIKTNYSFRIFGQGNSTKLALIGESSKKHQIEMGTPADKIIVIGHPHYEAEYNSILQNKNSIEDKKKIYEKIGIPFNSKFILWANGVGRINYSRQYSDEFMSKSLEKQLLIILESDRDIYIIFKLHPRGDKLFDFKYLEKISSRIKVITDGNLEEILPFSNGLVIRYSMASIYGVLLNIPVISINYPPLPAGSFFDEIGGVIYIKNIQELKITVKKLLSKDVGIFKIIENKRRYFLEKHLSLETKNKDYKQNISIENFKKLIAELIN